MNTADLLRHYSGKFVRDYEATRRSNPKWRFEEETLCGVLERLRDELSVILDAPVGTGRFLPVYEKKLRGVEIFCLDSSADMLQTARRRPGLFRKNTYRFTPADIIAAVPQMRADLSVCCRFLNLLDWDSARRVLANILSATDGYALFSIRLVDSGYAGPRYIENKIYLHCEQDLGTAIAANGFEVVRRFHYEDTRPGAYTIVLCARQAAKCWINKNRRVVYLVGPRDNPTKIYQVQNEEHARFIAAATSADGIKGYFPQVRHTRVDFVCAPWVDGEAFDPSGWAHAVALLKVLHAFPCDAHSAFDYVEDIVLPRFDCLRPLMDEALHAAVRRTILDGAQALPLRLSHPDVTPRNLIRVKGALVLIDNELLCCTRHFMIDVLNLLKNFPQPCRRAICECCRAELEHPDGPDVADAYLQALWLAREAGSALITTRLDHALHLTAEYARGTNILPVSLQELHG